MAAFTFKQVDPLAKKLVTDLHIDGARVGRAVSLVTHGNVSHVQGKTYLVKSANTDEVYSVDLANKTCSCPDNAKGNRCKHRIAAYLVSQLSVA